MRSGKRADGPSASGSRARSNVSPVPRSVVTFREGVDAGLAMRRLSFQRRCLSLFYATALFQGGRFRPLRDGSDSEVVQASARVVDFTCG